MSTHHEPVVLELAPLPREQLGPFLLLGVDKDAGAEEIEANWAQRVVWARKNVVPTALGDINWAREVINDPNRRVRADVTSLNPDLSECVVARLTEEFSLGTERGPSWQPLDVDKPLEQYRPPTELPDPEAVRAGIVLPDVPAELPAVLPLLQQWAREPLDPWEFGVSLHE